VSAPSDEASECPLLVQPAARHSQSGVELVTWQLHLASYFGYLIGWIGLQTGSVTYLGISAEPVAALLAETGLETGCLTECWQSSWVLQADQAH